MDQISTYSTITAGDFKHRERSGKGMDQKTASTSGQEEEEMTADLN